MKYQLTQFSLRGARPHNEDRVGYAERDNAMIMAVADGLGLSSTPSLLINGRLIRGAVPASALAEVIDDEIARHAGH